MNRSIIVLEYQPTALWLPKTCSASTTCDVIVIACVASRELQMGSNEKWIATGTVIPVCATPMRRI